MRATNLVNCLKALPNMIQVMAQTTAQTSAAPQYFVETKERIYALGSSHITLKCSLEGLMFKKMDIRTDRNGGY